MLIDIFKKSYIHQTLFIVLVASALWAKSFIFPEGVAVATEPYSLLYSYIEGFAKMYPVVSVVVAFLLVFAQGIYFNHILVSNYLIHKTTLFPMFVYIMLMSMAPQNQTFTPLLFSNIFLLIALHNIINCYNQEHSYEKVFNASFCIALAFLFYFPSIYMLVFVIASFVVYKLYYWREWLVMLLGFVAPFFSLFAYYYVVDKFDTVMRRLSDEAMRVSLNYDFSNTVGLICGSATALFAIVSLVAIWSNLSEKVIIYRKKATVLLLLMLVGIAFSLYDILLPANQQNYVMPMSFMLPTFFLMLRNNKKVCNTVFVVFLAVVFANAYLRF